MADPFRIENRDIDVPSGDQPVQLPAVIVRVSKYTATGPGRAAFISQLIAERYHMAPQRERRRATVAVAVDSYAAADASGTRRLPPGYRKAMLV